MESIKYEPKRRKSVIVKAMHFLKRKYCQFDEFIIPLLLNDIPLLAGRCVIFHLESAKKASKDPQTRLYFKYYTTDCSPVNGQSESGVQTMYTSWQHISYVT